VINIPRLEYGWGSSIAAISSTAKVRPIVLLQRHVCKYSGSLLVPAWESHVPSFNKPKVPKEIFQSARDLVLLTSLLSSAVAHVRSSLVPVSVILSVSLLSLLVEKSLLWSLPPSFQLRDTPIVPQAARERVAVLLASLFKF